MLNSVVIFSTLVLMPLSANADLTLSGKNCGTKICSLHEFCSNFNKQCESCSDICEESSHNFDRKVCMSECQDYIHDLRYARSSRYEDDIQKLKRQQEIMLILLIVLLVLFTITYGVRFYKWTRGRDCLPTWLLKKIKPWKAPGPPPTANQPSNDITHENPHTESPKPPRRVIERSNSNVFSVSGVDGSTVQTVSTPISTRYPAENSTTDYSYDNAALQVTPVTEKPRGTETTF